MNPRLTRALRWLVTALMIVFLVIFARTIEWASAWQSIRSASLPLLVAAIAVNFVSIAVKGVRWWLFLKPAGSRSLGLSMRATIAGSGLNNILVANGGDAARVVFVSRATALPSSTVLATLALERLFDVVGFVVLLVYGALAFKLPENLARWTIPAEITLAGIFVLLGWFVYTSRHAVGVGNPRDEPVHGFAGRVKAYLARFAESTRALTSTSRFAGALVISMIAWAGQLGTFQLAAAAAHVSIAPEASFVALLATNLGLLIRATPGNVGVFQVVFALSVAPFGVARDDAIAVSLLIQTLQIIPVTLAGVALAPEFLFRRNAARKEAAALAHAGQARS